MKKVILFLCMFCSVMWAAVDLNSATKQQLMSLKGIGKAKAMRIIEYREKTPFKSIKDLKHIKGFGQKLIDKLSPQIEVKALRNPS